MGAHEVTLKEYFEEKLKSKDKDVDSLSQKLAEKEEDIRSLIVKYNALEKRFDLAMEAQEKIRDFEEKIRKLGLDQNLVKNMAELFAAKQ
jgi:chromosome segregation ATPase